MFYNMNDKPQLFKKGYIPWNKGKKGVQVAWNKGIPHIQSTKDKISEKTKGRIPSNKGIPMSQEQKDLISKANTGKIRSKEHKRKVSNFMKNIVRTDEWRNNISKSLKNKSFSQDRKNNIQKAIKIAMQRPEVKKNLSDSLTKTKWIKVKTDIGQIDFINKWNSLGCFNFEINYQIRIGDNIYYLDGYDKERNMVLEYDGKSHTKNQKADLIRQNNIIKYLKPKRFWRYDFNTKQIRSVLGIKEIK